MLIVTENQLHERLYSDIHCKNSRRSIYA